MPEEFESIDVDYEEESERSSEETPVKSDAHLEKASEHSGHKNIMWLREISKEDTPLVGGKGANLGEMFNSDFPVPDAFVLTSNAFRDFLNTTHLKQEIFSIIKSIRFEDTQDLEEKAKKIREKVINAEMPPEFEEEILKSYEKLGSGNLNEHMIRVKDSCFVAVRSSATAEDLAETSFAGQNDTFVNMRGNEQVIGAIKKCWASLYTARSIYYRNKNNIDEETILIAVVVQKMVNSEKSGVMFTTNPLTNDPNQLVIEGVFGLGEGIVSGAIEPDHFLIDKKTEQILEKRIGKKKIAITRDSSGRTIKQQLHDAFMDKEVLYTHEIKDLIRVAKRLEEHYHFPQDIEYAFEGGNLYIVQTRPISTLNKKQETQEVQGKVLLEGLAASRGMASGKVKLVLDLNELYKVQPGDVLVTRMTNPDMVVSMQKATAIVTDEGGSTCHAAIVSRELGIPCVVGTKIATQILKDNGRITVDGTNGKVYAGDLIKKQLGIRPEESKVHEVKDISIEVDKHHAPVSSFQGSKPDFAKMFGQPTKSQSQAQSGVMVKVNCDLPMVAERAAATGADGVGLVRIEFIIAEGGKHPAYYLKMNQLDEYSRLLAENLEHIARAFKGKPIWVRTSDIRTDEYTHLQGADEEPKESNPMLGWHGIRRSLDQPDLLQAEFKAIKILHDKGHNNVGIMIPFVINAEEVRQAKEICRLVGLEPRKDVEFGVMIETPGACMIIEDLCNEGIDFISFGTNDLTQLTLGLDRNNEIIAKHYHEKHAGVLRLLEMVITVCKMYNVKSSICGQAGSDPEMAKFLAKKGISSISANIDAVQDIRDAIK
jgi:pyruvate,water dikinase